MIKFNRTRKFLDKMDNFFKGVDEAKEKVKEYKKIDDDVATNKLLKEMLESIENLKANAIKEFLAEYILIIAISEAEEKLEEIIEKEIKVLEKTNAYKILSPDNVSRNFLNSLKFFPKNEGKKEKNHITKTKLPVDLEVVKLYLNFKDARNDVAHEGGDAMKVSWEQMHGRGESTHPEIVDKKIYVIGEEIVNGIDKYIKRKSTPRKRNKEKKDYSSLQDSSQD